MKDLLGGDAAAMSDCQPASALNHPPAASLSFSASYSERKLPSAQSGDLLKDCH
jgi:hypothetical protein